VEGDMQDQVLPECTATIEPQVVDLGEPSVDGYDGIVIPDLIVPCMPVPED
jgi:hypothetical protein